MNNSLTYNITFTNIDYKHLHVARFQKEKKGLTGAMYSSVPTKEFDARIGSAMKIGLCWPF